jgi:hypothetical protein
MSHFPENVRLGSPQNFASTSKHKKEEKKQIKNLNMRIRNEEALIN